MTQLSFDMRVRQTTTPDPWQEIAIPTYLDGWVQSLVQLQQQRPRRCCCHQLRMVQPQQQHRHTCGELYTVALHDVCVCMSVCV